MEEEKKAETKVELNIEEIQKQLEESEKKCAEYLAGWQRARADFINYKKEEMERIGNLIQYSTEELIINILPVLDNFNLATPTASQSGGQAENDKFVQGILQVKKQLEDFLKSLGVEEIKVIGEKFDPNFHEVIEIVEPDGKEPNVIVEEVQKGYTINKKLLRPAKVKVTK